MKHNRLSVPKPNFTKTGKGKVRMNKANGPVDRIKIGLGIALLAALTGCVGYVDGGYGGGRWWCRGLMCIFSAATMTGGAMCMIIVIAELKAVRWRTRPGPRRRTLPAAGTGESGEPHNSLDRNRPDEPMKLSNQLTRFASLLTIALLAGAWGILSADLHAAEPKEAQQKPVVAQRLFASPDEAVKALQAAAEAKDKAALREIFGPEFDELLTGDEVQDANNAQRFATAHGAGLQAGERGGGQNHS